MIHTELLDGLRDKAITRYIGQVLRRAKIELPEGDAVRAFQSYTKFEQKDGKEVQLAIWKDIDSMSRAQMLIACKERKRHADECLANIKTDVKYWNEKVRPKVGGSQIKLDW